MGLKWPLSRGSQFKCHFYLGDGKTEDCAKVFTSPLFEGSSINGNEIRDNLSRTKCMAMQTWLEIKRQIYESRSTHGTRLLENFPLL